MDIQYNELTKEQKEETQLLYGEPYMKYHNCGDNVFSYTAPIIISKKGSDICFGDVSTDVVCIYCERCLTIIDIRDYQKNKLNMKKIIKAIILFVLSYDILALINWSYIPITWGDFSQFLLGLAGLISIGVILDKLEK